jgi:Tol biopolymer transport system component
MLALAAGLAWYRARSVPPPLARFLVYAPENTTFAAGRRMATMAAVSPDGRTLAFTVADTSGKRLLWLRPIDSLTPRPLPGTDGASYPFWSPDNQWIAYMTDGKLMKVSAAGGQPVELCAAPSSAIVGRGGAWSRDNVIVFNNGPGPLHRISASGGQAQPVGGAAPPGVGNFTFPSFLPDGRHVLAYANAPVEDQQGLYVVSLDTGESKRILSADSGAIYAPEAGRLLYVRQGALLAHRFDPTTFAANGDPITVAERVEHTVVPGVVAFSLSNTGVLAYGTADPSEERYQLEWIARDGTPKESVGQPSPYMGLDLSPDGRHVAVHLHDAGGDIWVMEVSTGRTIKFTANVSQDSRSPVWSRKGDRIAYASRRDGKWGIYVKPWNAAGDEERVFESDGKALLTVQPWSWAPGDDSIVQSMYDNKVQTDLYRLPLSGDRQPTPLVRSPALDVHGQISPDGKWLAYMSLETGEARIYVQSLSSTARWPVSSGGGVMPRWRGDGHELFYLAGTSMMAVDVTATGSVFESGKPHTLFEHGSTLGQGNLDHLAFSYAVDREGQRFLIARKPANERREQKPPIAVVLNWAEGLKLQ